jgi:arylsulfatase A-like enzyme
MARLLRYLAPPYDSPPVRRSPSLDRRRLRSRRGATLALVGLVLGAGAVACWPRHRAPRPSVLLLTVDTLRADHLGAWGYPRATSPVLDQLAREGVRFERAQVQWPKTTPSFASMLTATYPKDNGMVRAIGTPLPCALRTLAEELRGLGYQTAAVVANGAIGSEFYFDQGFQTYVEAWKGAADDAAIEIATRPDHVTSLALETLTSLKADRPYFLWVHYLDPHFPYRPPPPWRDEFQGDAFYSAEPRIALDRTKPKRATGAIGTQQILEDRDDLGFYVARYDAEIRFTDHEIGKLLGALRARGDYDRMLTVFTADHGESLGEHGYYFDHGMLPFQDGLHVPFAVRYPPGLEPRVDPDPVELIHLAPTVLEYAGAKLEKGVWAQGRSLVPRLRGRASGRGSFAYSEAGYGTMRKWMYVVSDGRHKLVWAQRPQDQWHLGVEAGVERVLYDLASDPGETVNVADRFPREFEALSRRLSAWYGAERFAAARDAADCVDARTTDPATIEQLKALGYL